MLSPTHIINRLKLQPNPAEGGYFATTYESAIRLADADLPGFPVTDKNGRPLCSAIYYFLDQRSFSALHKVTGDMLYHFYNGDPVQMLLLYPGGHSEAFIFSNDLSTGGNAVKVIPGGTWLGSRLIPGGDYALMGVTMAPGFHPNDYSIGQRQVLVDTYPDRKEIITELTRS